MNTKRTLLLVTTLLSSSLTWVTAQAAVEPKGLWRPSTETVVEILNLPGDNRVRVLREQPDGIYETLIQMAFDQTRGMDLRWKALTGAAQVKREKSLPEMVKASKHQDWFMRNAALVAMSEVAPEKGAALAVDLLSDKALVVRSAAVDVLGKKMTSGVRDLLWEEMQAERNRRQGQSLWIRAQIAKLLAREPMPHEHVLFSRLLSETDERLQSAGVRGLEKITGKKLGEGLQMTQVVRLWRDEVNRPASGPR